jgi:hypothetical protein
VVPDRSKVPAAGEQVDVASRARQAAAEVAADSACTNDRDPHRLLLYTSAVREDPE